MDTVKEWCKTVRDMGVLVGVGTHIPEVIAKIEEENWDVDFYAGCVYNRRRTAAEWKKALGGEIMEMPRDVYMASDPPRMYSVLRQTKKPCFAFKILGPPSKASSRTMACTLACSRNSGTKSAWTPKSSSAS
jgi:hypothetical protein